MSLNRKLFSKSASGPCVSEDLQPLGDSSCVAYYSLDYDASDKSTNYDGTPSNVEFVQNGKINYSAKFNGTTSKIQITSPIGVASGNENDNFSVSMWVKWDSVSSTASGLHGTLVGDYTGSNYGSFHIYVYGLGSGNGLALSFERYFNSTAYWNSSYLTVGTISTLEADTWYYITHTYVGSSKQVKLYSNTTLIATYTLDTASGGRTTNSYNVIGDYNNSSGNGHAGLIDEFRIFNKTLSSDEVSTLAGLTACTPTCTTDTADFIATNTAYYKLDGDATDSHGGTYDATATNITYASGRFASSAEFNGSSSILDTTVSVPTNWTLSLWLKRDPSGYFGGTTNASVRSGVYFYSNPNGSIAVYNRDGSGGNIDTFYSSAGLVNQNQWHHIAMSFDSTSGTGLTTIYIDGSEIGSVDGTPSHSTAFKFGRSGDYASDYFDGYIDQIRIFSSALTDTNIQDLYDTEFQCYITKNAADPFGGSIEEAFYKFEENTGTSLTDSSGNGNTGTINGMTWSSNDPAFGSYSGSFDGTNDRITVPAGLGTSGNRARSFWIKINAMPSSGDGDNIYYIGNTSDNEYYETVAVQNNSGSYVIRWQERHDTSTTSTKDSTATLTTGVWYHIAVVQDGTSRKIYINGNLDSTHTNSNSVNNTSYPAVIGSFREGASCCYYDGLLDQFRFFNAALSGEQVWKLYAERNN